MRGSDTIPPVAEAFEGHLHETADKRHMSNKKTSDILVKGIHLDRYHVNLNADGPKPRWLAEKEVFFEKKPAALGASKKPKLVGKSTINKQTPRRMQFSSLEPDIVITNNVKFILVSADILPNYVLGILNSGLAEWFISKFATTNRITNYEVENIPFLRCSISEQRVIAILAQTLSATRENEDIVKMKIIDRVLDACIFELYFNLNAGLLRNLASSIPDIDPISVEEVEKNISLQKNQNLTREIYRHEWVECIMQVLKNRGVVF